MRRRLRGKDFLHGGIAMLLIIALAGCATGTTPDEQSPLKTADPDQPYRAALIEYMAYLSEGQYEGMYALLDDASRARITQDDFVARNRNIYSGIEARDIRVAIEGSGPLQSPGGAIEGSEPPPTPATASDGAEDTQPAGDGRIVRYSTSMETSAGPISWIHEAAILEAAEGPRIAWDSSMIFPNLGEDDRVRVYTETGQRGGIYDRNGVMLAGEGIVKSVGLVRGKMGEDRAEDIVAIAEILQVTPESIEKKLTASWVKDDHFVPLRCVAENDTARKDALLAIPGVRINDAYDRVYPLGTAAAHLTGYVQAINKEELDARVGQGYHANSKLGKIGLESLLEDRIRGIDGCRIAIVDAEGNRKELLAERPAVHGEDIALTIDAGLQVRLYEQLMEDKSAAAVINPKNGEVLALLSTPAYDPNQFVLGLSNAQWEAWRDDERKPMYNRFKAALVPGSCFKPIIAAIGLTEGAFTAQENFGHAGRSWQKDASWGGYKVTTLKDYGDDVVLENALVYSDNIYFAKAALRIGDAALAKAFDRVGFGQSVPFEFGLSASSYGKDGGFGSEIDLADSGYGQGRILVNPLHVASLYSAFVNGGDMIAPHLEKRGEGDAEIWIADAFSAEAARTVREALIQVVENPKGSAHEAQVKGKTLAGKTGTAEIKDSKDDTTGTELGWYVTFTADEGADQPLLFVAMVEDVKDRGGSHYVLPVGKSVFTR